MGFVPIPMASRSKAKHARARIAVAEALPSFIVGRAVEVPSFAPGRAVEGTTRRDVVRPAPPEIQTNIPTHVLTPPASVDRDAVGVERGGSSHVARRAGAARGSDARPSGIRPLTAQELQARSAALLRSMATGPANQLPQTGTWYL